MVRLLDTLPLLTGSVIISGNEEAYVSLMQLPGGAAYHQPVSSLLQHGPSRVAAVPGKVPDQAHATRTSPEASASALRSKASTPAPPHVADMHQPMPGGAASADSWALPRPPMSTSRSAWALPPSPGHGATVALAASAAEDLHAAHDEEVAALREENALLNKEETWRAAEGLQLRKEAAELRRGAELLLRQNDLLRQNYTQLVLQHEQAARIPEGATILEHTHEVPLHNGPEKNKALLAILEAVGLGIFGVDRCYMGDTCRGIVKGITFGGFVGWAVLDYFVVLVNTIEKADYLDVLGFNATFRKKAFREDLSKDDTSTTPNATTEIDAAFYIMILSYGCLFAGEVFLCLHWKLSPSERAAAARLWQHPHHGQQQGYAEQGSGQHDVNQRLNADHTAQAAGSQWGVKQF